MKQNFGLKAEILTTITLLVGAALLLVGVLMLRLTEQSLLNQHVSQLKVTTETIASALVSYPDWRKNQDSVSGFLRNGPKAAGHQGWQLFDSSLRVIASYGRLGAEPFPVQGLEQVKISGEWIESISFPSLLNLFRAENPTATFALPLLTKNRFIGIFAIRYSLEEIRQQLIFSQRMIFFYVVLYGAVLVFIGYYLLQRNLVTPAKNLLEATTKVGRGEMDTRLPVAGPLEIAGLASSFNQMVSALIASRLETEQKIEQLETTNVELRRTKKELFQSEKLASVGQLAAGMAHEVGNPLAALTGYLEILKMRPGSQENLEIIDRSINEAQRIDRLVQGLLDYSRPALSQMESLHPEEELQNAIELLRHQGKFGQLVLDCHLPADLPSIRIARQNLQQVYVNLLLNAADACGPGGRIRISGEVAEGSVSLVISDNGPGISAEAIGRIFDPFYTTKEPGKGTGLGLAICHRIMEEAGGEITVRSRPDFGTSFQLIFPMHQR